MPKFEIHEEPDHVRLHRSQRGIGDYSKSKVNIVPSNQRKIGDMSKIGDQSRDKVDSSEPSFDEFEKDIAGDAGVTPETAQPKVGDQAPRPRRKRGLGDL